MLFRSNGDDYTVTISYKSDKPSKAENEFDTDQKFSKEDIVVLTIGGTEIQSMAKAEIVEGTVSSVKDNDYVKLDGDCVRRDHHAAVSKERSESDPYGKRSGYISIHPI